MSFTVVLRHTLIALWTQQLPLCYGSGEGPLNRQAKRPKRAPSPRRSKTSYPNHYLFVPIAPFFMKAHALICWPGAFNVGVYTARIPLNGLVRSWSRHGSYEPPPCSSAAMSDLSNWLTRIRTGVAIICYGKVL